MRFRELALEGEEKDCVRELAREAVEELQAGGILVHPTSTLYGIGGEVTGEMDAVIASLKGRCSGAYFIRLAPDADTVKALLPAGVWSAAAERLSRAFWPGGLTLVFEDGSLHGMAVRVDSHPVLQAVMAEYGALLTSTSVNRRGEPAARDPATVRSLLSRLPDVGRSVVFLSAGAVPAGAASTVISLMECPPRLIREGVVAVARVEECLREKVVR